MFPGLRCSGYTVDVSVRARFFTSLRSEQCGSLWWSLSPAKRSFFDEAWELYLTVNLRISIQNTVRNHISRFSSRVCHLSNYWQLARFRVPDMSSLLLNRTKSHLTGVGYPRIKMPLLHPWDLTRTVTSVVCRLCSWVGLLVVFLPWQLAQHLLTPWELVLREEASRSVQFAPPKFWSEAYGTLSNRLFPSILGGTQRQWQ